MRWMLQSRILKCSLHSLVFKDVGGGYVNLVCITNFAYVCSGWHSAVPWLLARVFSEFPTVQRQSYQVDWNLRLPGTTWPCYIRRRDSSTLCIYALKGRWINIISNNNKFHIAIYIVLYILFFIRSVQRSSFCPSVAWLFSPRRRLYKLSGAFQCGRMKNGPRKTN